MRPDQALLRAVAIAAAAVAALLLAYTLAAWALVGSALSPAEQAAVGAALAPRWGLLLFVGLALAGAAGAALQPLLRRWVTAPARLLEQAQVLLRTDGQRPLAGDDGAPVVQALARSFNDLAQQRDQLRQDMARQVAEASRGVAQERNRLAALMSELTQSVVVCNLDGRILLYNNRARLQFRALSAAPQLADGAELIGLGRSVYAVVDRKLVAHALDSVQLRLQRGVAHPSAQFVTTTRSGQLLRVQLAPVRAAVDAVGDALAHAAPPTTTSTALSGFVLMLDNITRTHAAEAAQQRLLQGLTEGSRGALANLQAAVEMLGDPGLPPDLHDRFVGVIREEAQAMGRRIHALAAQNADALATRWPLEDMLGADFLQAAGQRVAQATGLRTSVLEQDDTLWLKLDSFALLQCLASLAQRLRDGLEVQQLQLRLLGAGPQHAHLDLLWTGQAMSTETAMGWEMDPMTDGPETGALSVRDVVQRHGGEFWFERDRARHQAFFRFLLPLAPQAAQDQADAAALQTDSRPEFYDFDLFAHTESSHALDERRLADLTFTVFDTETTGLNPTGGDEILQIGATRLLHGRLLRGETFDQLVDPRRDIPAAGIPIHGITPDMVAGKPDIRSVLPAFHAFAFDTVLVAHNAAFDMRFLQLKEKATGLRFDQPVLDTLLLSAVVHPHQESHRLEAIAERLGVPVVGRHTALGDALVTAEVFQKLIPLLADMGIHTLGQARKAAQKTYFARLSY